MITQNANLKAQILEKVFAVIALKNELRKSKGNSMDTKFAKPSVLRKPILQPLRNQSVVRKPTSFKFERPKISKQQFASQVDVEKDLSKPVTQHYLPKGREYAFAKLHHVNSRAKVKSHKTRRCIKPVEQKSHNQKPGRQIFTGHRFSPNKSFVVYEKTSPRYCLRWKPTGKILNTVSLRWIPTGTLLDSCTTKVDSEPSHGSHADISKIHKCKQTLDLSAASHHNVNRSSYIKYDSYDVNDRVGKSSRSLFDEYFNGENLVVSKSFVVTTVDAFDKRQKQPYLTSSTSTLATTVTADGNFDFDDGNPSRVNIKQLCDASVMRTASTAVKPCQEDSYEFYLITGNLNVGVVTWFLALGWHLEEIHVTWAHLEKKRTRLRLYTKNHEKLCIQRMETAPPS
ncbi:hypothetical protein Tco_0682953 [Tanacetum coccineum]|uniref:Uncharacterized protein n=1 Tax=Tanacetum coccineum TaxID=301880 RepID=A0ABQ4XUK1_9ASTR